MTSAALPGAEGATHEVAPATKRRRTPLLIAALSVTALSIAAGVHVLTLGRESTDDAQVEGHVMNVSARVPGQVLRVRVVDNQTVNAGDVLIELDPAEYQAKVAGARADLAAARAAASAASATLLLTMKAAPGNLTQARGGATAASSSVVSARAAVEQAKAGVTFAQARQVLATSEWQRGTKLFAESGIAGAELDARQAELDASNAALSEARARLEAANAALSGSGGGLLLAHGRLSAAQTVDEQIASARAASELADARVAQMESALTLAELNLSYTTVRAARRGVVSRRTVEEGQMVSPERPLFAIVPLDDVWIVANFKEDQLGDMRVGNSASVEVDTYEGRHLTAHVESVAGGTGARFALLPPDNATGNFVKVVQRIPVLLRIDDGAGLALRPGMSADVTVDTRLR